MVSTYKHRSSDLRRPSDVELTAEAFGMTDRGRERASNQDHFLIGSLVKTLHFGRTSLLPSGEQQDVATQGYLFVVADGMGGYAGGARASRIAVEAIESFMLHELPWFPDFGRDEKKTVSLFQSAYEFAEASIMLEAEKQPQLSGMGTTLTTACVVGRRLVVAHAGDSRVYLLRAGLLDQLTSDHTLAGELASRGAISEKESQQHMFKHVLTNAVGDREPRVWTEMQTLLLKSDDVLLVCSDGLTNMVDDETICAVLYHELDAETACQRLVDQANKNGGKDNIAVIVARFSPMSD